MQKIESLKAAWLQYRPSGPSARDRTPTREREWAFYFGILWILDCFAGRARTAEEFVDKLPTRGMLHAASLSARTLLDHVRATRTSRDGKTVDVTMEGDLLAFRREARLRLRQLTATRKRKRS